MCRPHSEMRSSMSEPQSPTLRRATTDDLFRGFVCAGGLLALGTQEIAA